MDHQAVSDSPPERVQQLLSVVVPVYNEEEVVEEFYRRAEAALSGLPDINFELIFVDDGCVDRTYEILTQVSKKDARVRVVKLSRNFGHQLAITAGIDLAAGDAVVVIDADLQDPPEVIGRMVERWQEGIDVVYAVRKRRDGEGWLKLVTAKYFYRTLDWLADTRIPKDVGDFRLMSRRATNELCKIREHDRYVRGLVSWIGFRQAGIEYERDARYAGETKYTWMKMLAFAWAAITSFSTAPLKVATWLGYISSGLAFVYLVVVIAQWLAGNTVPGWATTSVLILFFGGVQLICLGIMGEYVGRVFIESKRRPLYIIDHVLGKRAVDEGVECTSESHALG